MIKAPFNFVPLNDKVFFPDWAQNISIDIPFEDGICGSIKVRITSETPIFVRNGHTRAEGGAPASEKTADFKSFSKAPDGKYFIPSTSIKGSVRNVLEILSFSKMNRIANNRYSIRDLSSAQNKYMKFFQEHEVHCGWMSKSEDKNDIIITDNGIPGRLSLQDFMLQTNVDLVSKVCDQNFLKSDSNRTAKRKYEIAGNACLTGNFKRIPLNPKNPVDKRIKVKYSESGEHGRIVFTGQPSVRKKGYNGKWQGKIYEFVFFDKTDKRFVIKDYEENDLFKDFCFIYQKSEDWNYWKEKFSKGESVPIFLTSNEQGLLSFGLSYLYKLPFPQKIKKYLGKEHLENNLDLSECIFGTSDFNLKGRVQFSHAFCTKGDKAKEIKPYMGGPKPTFYPIYLQQNGSNGIMDSKFKTMLDQEAKLRGWKRYPVRPEVDEYDIPEGQENNTSPSIPLSANSEFEFTVRFHNLRPVELGALLYAIELKPNCLHSIGFAKNLGYGSCKFEIESLQAEGKNKESLIQDFINLMSGQISNYEKTPQLRELFAMMRKDNAGKLTVPLEYMEELNDFVKVKRQNFKKGEYGEYQQNYTELIKKEALVATTPTKVQATVIVYSGAMKQARLLDSQNQKPYTLEVPPTNKVKIKIGDKIEAESILNAKGKIKALKFIQLLK